LDFKVKMFISQQPAFLRGFVYVYVAKGEYFTNDMETTIKLKVAELGPAVIEAIKLLAQGNPEAEVTISVRLARPAAPVAQALHQASATPGGFSANYLAGSPDEEDDLSDPFGDMTKILK
jgi:hypothetical protein